MLVLEHKVGEYVEVGETKITILEVHGGRVKLGYEAPPDVKILRDKVIAKMRKDPPPSNTAPTVADKPPPDDPARTQAESPPRRKWPFGLIIGGKSA